LTQLNTKWLTLAYYRDYLWYIIYYGLACDHYRYPYSSQ